MHRKTATSGERTRPSPLAGGLLAPPVVYFIAACTVLAVLAAKAGFFGIPLALALAYAFANYALALLEARAQGRPVPVLSVEMLNPAHHPKPIGILLFLLLAGGALTEAYRVLGAGTAYVLAGLLAGALPGMIALWCIDDRWLVALSPGPVTRFIRALGLRYAGYLCVAAVAFAAAAWMATRIPTWLALAVGQFVVLSLATLLGELVYVRRAQTGHDVWAAPEIDARRVELAEDRHRAQVLEDVYGLLRANKPQAAWDAAGAWLSSRGTKVEDLAWLRDRAVVWEDGRFAGRLTAEIIGQLLRRGDPDEALHTASDWLAAGRGLHIADPRLLGRLVGTARIANQAGLADRVLDQCGPAHRADPEIAGMLERRARERAG